MIASFTILALVTAASAILAVVTLASAILSVITAPLFIYDATTLFGANLPSVIFVLAI